MIVIDSSAMPLKMLFKTASANLDIKQEHENAPANAQESSSVDGEIVLKHTVKKPVVQYVYEEIVPSRYLTQKVEPVKEYVKTIISKNEPSSNDVNGNGNGNGNGNKNGNGNGNENGNKNGNGNGSEDEDTGNTDNGNKYDLDDLLKY